MAAPAGRESYRGAGTDPIPPAESAALAGLHAGRAERAADQTDRRARDADRISRWAVGAVIAALFGFVGLAVQGERNAANQRAEMAAMRAEMATMREELQGEIAFRIGQVIGLLAEPDAEPETPAQTREDSP